MNCIFTTRTICSSLATLSYAEPAGNAGPACLISVRVWSSDCHIPVILDRQRGLRSGKSSSVRLVNGSLSGFSCLEIRQSTTISTEHERPTGSIAREMLCQEILHQKASRSIWYEHILLCGPCLPKSYAL
ncbi:hypothetical protein M434DRAFT_221097 [Hypoxylon sp. CO27-5]|nr:hypothetical protein M434DRAFT_221097 [Hypoxylon sp. CO27-5]